MPNFSDLRKKLNNIDTNMKKNIGHLGNLSKDAQRVSDIAKNAPLIIDDIDRKFEQITKLTRIDIIFLFLAIALQVVRQYLITNFKERKGDQDAAKDSKEIEKKILGEETKEEKKDRMNKKHKWYHPSIEEVTFNPVPFDQVIGLSNFNINIGGAFKHRASTPGHDAILGYIFGTANIATATLTTWPNPKFNSFHIKYSPVGNCLKPKATDCADTEKVFEYMQKRLTDEGKEGKIIAAISLFREAMHLKSDVNSKVSLPIPIVTTISPDFAEEIANYGIDLGNLQTVGRQAIYSGIINKIIAILHRIIYKNNDGNNILQYEVRTRKILTYSNTIASSSNLLFVAIMSVIGVLNEDPKTVKKAISFLDIGGLLVTVYRIVTDTNFIMQVKQEFLEKEFYNLVVDEKFDF